MEISVQPSVRLAAIGGDQGGCWCVDLLRMGVAGGPSHPVSGGAAGVLLDQPVDHTPVCPDRKAPLALARAKSPQLVTRCGDWFSQISLATALSRLARVWKSEWLTIRCF